MAAEAPMETLPTDGLQANAAALGNPSRSASSEFMMYTYKVEMCSNPCNHDWAICPYAHVKDRARRRDPAVTHLAQPCPDKMQGRGCPRGEGCPYTHSVAEYWLHPARFRTQYCKQGRGCARRVCFFSHAPEELRSPSAAMPPAERAAAGSDTPGPGATCPVTGPMTAAATAAAAAAPLLLQAMAVDGTDALQPDGQPSLGMWQQAALAAAAPEPAAPQGLAAAAAYARQRRMSFEERSALRMRLYLEQQRGLALQADASGAAALALGAAVAPAAAQPGARRSSAASYASGSLLLPDLPESPTGQVPLGPLGLPTHSRRMSAASYCAPHGGADAQEMLHWSAAAAGQLPPGWTALAAGPGMPLRLRRASAASYGSVSQQMLVDCQLGGSAAGGLPGPGGMLPLRSRRASAASYVSGLTTPTIYAAPRSRRTSCTSTSTASAFSHCAPSTVMSDAVAGDGALDALVGASGELCCAGPVDGAAIAAAAAAAGPGRHLPQQQIMFARLPEDEAPGDVHLLGGPLFIWGPQPSPAGVPAPEMAALAGAQCFVPAHYPTPASSLAI